MIMVSTSRNRDRSVTTARERFSVFLLLLLSPKVDVFQSFVVFVVDDVDV